MDFEYQRKRSKNVKFKGNYFTLMEIYYSFIKNSYCKYNLKFAQFFCPNDDGLHLGSRLFDLRVGWAVEIW